jgi:hypothetical protein
MSTIDRRNLSDIKYQLGLPTRVDTQVMSAKIVQFLAEETIKQIITLTKFSTAHNLVEYIYTDSLEVTAFILDIVRTINANYKVRRIPGSGSFLHCKKLTINHDLDESLIDELRFIKSSNLKFNNVITKLGLDKVINVEDFKTLYHSNDYDFSSYTSFSNKEDQVIKFVMGEGCDDRHAIMSMLLLNKITNSENLFQKSDEYSLLNSDVLDILKTGDAINDNMLDISDLKEEFIITQVESKFTDFSNRETILSPVNSKFEGRKKREKLLDNDENVQYEKLTKSRVNKDKVVKEETTDES